jgi:hypothetical protein
MTILIGLGLVAYSAVGVGHFVILSALQFWSKSMSATIAASALWPLLWVGFFIGWLKKLVK